MDELGERAEDRLSVGGKTSRGAIDGGGDVGLGSDHGAANDRVAAVAGENFGQTAGVVEGPAARTRGHVCIQSASGTGPSSWGHSARSGDRPRSWASKVAAE